MKISLLKMGTNYYVFVSSRICFYYRFSKILYCIFCAHFVLYTVYSHFNNLTCILFKSIEQNIFLKSDHSIFLVYLLNSEQKQEHSMFHSVRQMWLYYP